MSNRWQMQEGWLSFFLLFVMLVSAAMAISAAGWTRGLEHLATAAILALVAGLLLAKSRFPALITHLFSLVYGLFAVSYLVGRMVEQPAWRERLIDLSERLVTFLNRATSGGASRDSLMFVLLLTGLFWLLGHVAAWYTFRRPRVWRVLLPIGLTMLVNYYVYTDPRVVTRTSLAPFTVVFLIAALLYVARTNVYLLELQWKSAQATYSTDVRIDFLRGAMTLAVVALLVMAIAPGAQAGPNISNLWGGIEDMRANVRDTAIRLFGSLDVRSRSGANPFTGRFLLGGPRNLGDQVLFDVQASDGRYWRAVIHDIYDGSWWDSSDEQTVRLSPGVTFGIGGWQMRREVTQTVTLYLPNKNTQLFAAPEPLRAPDISTKVRVSFEQDQMTPASILHSLQALRPGSVYQVVSSVSDADPNSLRAAGQFYPDEISQRYLQLPQGVTDRTRALAQEITAEHETVFDKAQAIEQYLRHNLRYDLNVPMPPDGRDFVDYVLFDLQAGYCDYYASSFVVLARSVGIPTRLARGYAQGEYNPEAQAYRVREKNGHSWPEVFFPGYGWIQFEPTVVIDPIEWPAPPPDLDAGAGPLNPNPLSGPPERLDLDELLPDEPDAPAGAAPDLVNSESFKASPVFLVLVGLLVVAGLGTGITYWATERRGMGGLNLVERAYARMWRFAAWLGVPDPPDQTPYERAEALTMLVPEGERPIQHITDMYVVERFAQGNGNGDGSEAEGQWPLLRPMLWKTWLEKKFSRFQQEDRQRRWRNFYETQRTGTKRQDEE